MLAQLLRPGSWRRNRHPSQDSGLSPRGSSRGPKWQRVHSETYRDEDDEDEGEEDAEEEYDDELRHEDEVEEPLLPIFSSEVLDKLPVYNLTHSIRLLVLQRCETTLSWDQLRSPQVSQFLVKPILQAIRQSHFSRATLYALIANALNFSREGQTNPGTVGISKTRALICELLAMRLLKEYTIRELIDALSYGFDPLQGVQGASGTATPGAAASMRFRQPAPARISTIEVAIRAQSKKFLAHPLVVQQLEAIWAGTIVFTSAADYLHRPPDRQPRMLGRSYGTIDSTNRDQVHYGQVTRRTAALYDPAESSLFKLSRLRVPRYRQLFSTCSFAIMLCLFIAVLVQRSVEITALEVLFWFWSAGYMLDEIVGLTEEGFGLYIMSIWNAFDIGILLLFIAYYALRLYGIVIPTARKMHTSGMAYDVLASTAVLLFPRLFSVLDHYRYFSQLLIAFRMMAVDLAAILILIIIACSGFFVAFTVAFPTNENFTPAKAAYMLFQILMGFTPAAWDIWDSYNGLGKAILTLFLCIGHFLIVTILITVLTNSFMAVVQNSNEEHQFLFAVNTLGMVKSDALFSYIPPSNIISWLMRPMMYTVPFRTYVRFNRTVIKITHFPLLWGIFLYERFILTMRMYEPTDLVAQRGRSRGKMPTFSIRGAQDLFSPGTRLRESSVATFHKDRALDEVFRRPFRSDASRRQVNDSASERKKTVVDDWMRKQDDEGGAEEPPEQPRSVVERLESKRPTFRRARTGDGRFNRRPVKFSRSVASDPEDMKSNMMDLRRPIQEEDEADDEEELEESAFVDESQLETESRQQNLQSEEHVSRTEKSPQPDACGAQADDEGSDKENRLLNQPAYFDTPHSHHTSRPQSRRQSGAALLPLAAAATGSASPIKAARQKPQQAAQRPASRHHTRTISTNTILYSPMLDGESASGTSPPLQAQSKAKRPTAGQAVAKPPPPKFAKAPVARSRSQSPTKGPASSAATAKGSGGSTTPGRLGGPGTRRPPSSHQPGLLGPSGLPNRDLARARPIMPSRGPNQPSESQKFTSFLALDRDRGPRKPSFNAMALDLASDLGDNVYRPDAGAAWTGMPASFSTQLQAAGMRAMMDRERRQQMQGRGRPGRQAPLGRRTPPNYDNIGEDDDATEADSEHARRMSRIVLARMSHLEQGFQEVLDEVRGWRRQESGRRRMDGVRTVPGTAPGSEDSDVDKGASPRKRAKGRQKAPAQVRRVDFGADDRDRSSV